MITPKVIEQDPASDQQWDLGLDVDEPEIDPKYHGRADLVVGEVIRYYTPGECDIARIVDHVAKMLDGFDND